MPPTVIAFAFLAIAGLATWGMAQTKPADAGPKLPDEKTAELIRHRTLKLRETIAALPATVPEPVRWDVEIYLKAVDWAERHHEYFDGGKAALTTLEAGLARAAEAAQGRSSWLEPRGKRVSRAYRSRIDQSLQPYAVSYPAGYGSGSDKSWRLDIVLHGRDDKITETKFLAQNNGQNVPIRNDFVQIDIYGRGNNAYRWAGEVDVFEVLEHFIAGEAQAQRKLIDPARIVLRGFSMGGAGTWHIGLHHPAKFCVIGPGAGFTNTHGYVKSLPNPLPADQELLLHIYDAVDYAENAFNLPIVAYSGQDDPQKAAADNVEARLRELKIGTMTHVIAPGLKHQFPAEWQAKVETELQKYAGAGKKMPALPENMRFVTYTLRYPKSVWFDLLLLQKHYAPARVELVANKVGVGDAAASVLVVKTTNVRRMSFSTAARSVPLTGLEIDGQKTSISETGVYELTEGRWLASTRPDYDGSNKLPGLQGPIDDAFCSGFVCVKGSGGAWHRDIHTAAQAQLDRLEREWDKWMRGKLAVKLDNEVTEEDLRDKNLIVFGDPGSNTLMAKALPKLPLQWDRDLLVVDGQRFDSAKYMPVLIYPNPLNPTKYIVLNSGHTFHDAEFRGTNALLYPHLGDFAIVRPLPTAEDPAAFEVMKSGMFNDQWRYAHD